MKSNFSIVPTTWSTLRLWHNIQFVINTIIMNLLLHFYCHHYCHYYWYKLHVMCNRRWIRNCKGELTMIQRASFLWLAEWWGSQSPPEHTEVCLNGFLAGPSSFHALSFHPTWIWGRGKHRNERQGQEIERTRGGDDRKKTRGKIKGFFLSGWGHNTKSYTNGLGTFVAYIVVCLLGV